MMDIKLPDQDGIGVLRQLKREHPELEVIVMTAFGGSSTAIKAMEHGAYDYVTKPFEIDDLLATLKRVFEHADMSSRGERAPPRARQARGRARAHHRRQPADARGLQAHRQGRRLRRDRPHHRRDRHRQGAGRRGAASAHASATRIRWSRSTAPRCRRRCWRASCSATRRARSPARCPAQGPLRDWRTRAPSSSTRSAR